MEVERANDSDSIDALLRRWAETYRHQRTKDRRPYVIVLSYLPSQKGNIGKPRGGIVASLLDAARGGSAGCSGSPLSSSAVVTHCFFITARMAGTHDEMTYIGL